MNPTNPLKPISDESFDVIVSRLDQFYQLSDAFKASLRPILFEVSYKKGAHILSGGVKQSMAWFVLEGLLQEITIDANTYTPYTTWFWLVGMFVYTTPGFFDQAPTQVSIKVVKDSRLVVLSYDNWQLLKESFQKTDKVTEIIRSDNVMARKLHIQDIQSLSTADRYLKNEIKINQLFQYIQLKHIAEFLGMSMDTLGKLRRRMMKIKREVG